LARAELEEQFRAGVPVQVLVRRHAELVDRAMTEAWRRFALEERADVALVAVGGYGRGELHPCSDVDVLVLCEQAPGGSLEDAVRRFVTFLWDLGLEPGHSVRTVKECVAEAERDITVATALMESRRLAGSETLYQSMRRATDRHHVWPSRAFFAAKLEEQRRRHRKFHGTAYNLEPNVKDGPGGLRDIQMIGWVVKRHFGAETLHDLVTHGFLTESEYRTLIEAQNHLWRVRFALHLLCGRREDRLLFDHQRALAEQFGYRDDGRRLAVEQFMKPYYRTITELGRLNEMLLELFQEAILHDPAGAVIERLNERFRARNRFLEATDPEVFKRTPAALLELFLWLQRDPALKGVRASTIRLVRDHRHLMDERLRRDPEVRALFLELLRDPGGAAELRRMHRYGLLGPYLPEFAAVEGQMQYDLFHAYTVDEHTLFVVDRLRAFGMPEARETLPLAAEIFRRLPKPELLYLAGLFHDIAKGRGGDHSELGARDALAFCLDHGISHYDARIVAWLVKNHLLMSLTAQRRDISDPSVINAFAAQVGDRLHLDYLYLLTVADIRGTNPNLWNDWKDRLLRDLYEVTEHALARGLENPIGKEELIREHLEEARRLLAAGSEPEPRVEALWSQIGDSYFLAAEPDEIAWHTRAILAAGDDELPLVRLRATRGGSELFVYSHDREGLFAAVASALERLGLNTLEARIITAANAMTLDSFVVVEADGSPIEGDERTAEVREAIAENLREGAGTRPHRRRARRELRHFTTPTQVTFAADEARARTMMEVVTADRPGLLSRIGGALLACGAVLQTAKIATFGERVEDMFYVTDRAGNPLSPEVCERLREAVIEALEEG